MIVRSEGNPQMSVLGNIRADGCQEAHKEQEQQISVFITAISSFLRKVSSSSSHNRHSHPLSSNILRRFAAMVGIGLFDLEEQFAFYGAYHNNKVNILTHVVCVWPLLFGGLTMLAYTKPLAPQLPLVAALPYHEYMILNYCFIAAGVYALFYMSLEYKSGSLAALLVLLCWVGANAVAQHIPYTSGWKLVALSQVVCWTAQFITHGFFERRSPALVENLVQACLLAPYFVLLEALHSVFHYEPYAGFAKNVQYLVNIKRAEFRAKKATGKRME